MRHVSAYQRAKAMWEMSTVPSTWKRVFLLLSSISCEVCMTSVTQCHYSSRVRTEKGHEAYLVADFDRDIFGRGQIIKRVMDTSGKMVWAAGSDPRGDGNAAAQI